MTLWEKPFNLEDALRSISVAPGGYSSAQIAERERSFRWPMPQEIRTLYRWFTPLGWKTAIANKGYAEFEGGFTHPYLMPLENAGWRNRINEDISQEIQSAGDSRRKRAPSWDETYNFVFGGTGYGEEIVFCMNPPELNTGLITCWVELPIPRGIVLGNSLAQWLTRFHACGNYEFGLAVGNLHPEMQEMEAEEDDPHLLEEPLRTELLLDHLRLNPDDKQAKHVLTQQRNVQR